MFLEGFLLYCVQAIVSSGLAPHCPVSPPCQCLWDLIDVLSPTNSNTVSCAMRSLTDATLPSLMPSNATFYKIDFSYNDFSIFTDDAYFDQFKLDVEIMDLTGNRFQEVPGAVKSLGSLETLTIKQNYIHTIASNTFDKLIYLTELDLSGNLISGIAARTFTWHSSLTTLRLDKNKISLLVDESFSGLSSLSLLDLSANSLSELEASHFNGLLNLKTLKLSSNSLTSLGSGVFVQLPNLYNLELESNGLSAVESDTFSGITNLKSLELSQN